jgi:hypothetical protein
MLSNIAIRNARKFTPAKAKVHLTLASDLPHTARTDRVPVVSEWPLGERSGLRPEEQMPERSAQIGLAPYKIKSRSGGALQPAWRLLRYLPESLVCRIRLS